MEFASLTLTNKDVDIQFLQPIKQPDKNFAWAKYNPKLAFTYDTDYYSAQTNKYRLACDANANFQHNWH